VSDALSVLPFSRAGADRDGLQVRGGIGGTSARLADLERTGRQLRATADELAEQGRAALAVATDPQLQATALLSPPTYARAEAALAAATLGASGLCGSADRVAWLGTGMLTVAQGYRRAEAVAGAALRAVAPGLRTSGLPIGVGPSMLVVGRHQLGRVPARLTLQLLTGRVRMIETALPVVPGLVGGVIGTLPGGSAVARQVFGRPTGPTSVAEVAAAVAVLGGPIGLVVDGEPWFVDGGSVRVRPVARPWPGPASGVADLLSRIPAEAPTEPTKIHVERTDGPAGRRWVVAVPGTTDWSAVAGRSPVDLTGNLRLLSGRRSAAMTAVLAALRETGVRRGEPVLLVGHSQGGMIAAALAADPAVRREFTISHLLTSGAPVGAVPVPEDVQVLSVEHTDDPVPQLDGVANRDRSNWVTVSGPAPTAHLSGADRAEPLLAHRGTLYRETAERVDRSADPSIGHWRAGVAPFLQGASGARWEVEISRVVTR
jgi:pimeloyl-ACP methyl ester carboxylesterase